MDSSALDILIAMSRDGGSSSDEDGTAAERIAEPPGAMQLEAASSSDRMLAVREAALQADVEAAGGLALAALAPAARLPAPRSGTPPRQASCDTMLQLTRLHAGSPEGHELGSPGWEGPPQASPTRTMWPVMACVRPWGQPHTRTEVLSRDGWVALQYEYPLACILSELNLCGRDVVDLHPPQT